MKHLRACFIVLLAVQFWMGTVQASDDDNRLSNLVDAAGMFNERGYSKANSFSLSGNEVINDFNGNLMYTQRLLYLPISENGIHCDIKLVYNGNVSHTAFGARSGMNGIVQTPINLPEWIISVNGIGVQTFNFENELVSWRNDTSYTADFSYTDDVAAHIEGYHKCYRERRAANGITNGVISILMEDGSVKELYSLNYGIEGPMYMIGGEYSTCSKDDPDRGYLWTVSDERYGYFTLFRSDGTQVDFKIYQPAYRTNLDCPESFPRGRADYPRILLPVNFRDQMGNELELDYAYKVYPDTVLGRPILQGIGETYLLWDSWTPGLTGGVRILRGGQSLYEIYYADAVTTPTFGGRGVSWIPTCSANRGLVWRIYDPQQRITKFSYRTYRRTFTNMNFGDVWRQFNICNSTVNKEAGAGYRIAPWRLWKIDYPEGGHRYISYFNDLATAWGHDAIEIPKDTITISYDHTDDCMDNLTPKFPCRKSAYFDELGRDPFFLNIVSASRRTTSGGEIVNSDSLMYSWESGTDPMDTTISVDDVFSTVRWFGKDSLYLSLRNEFDQIKQRHIDYRYYPENGLFSKNSRDRGWALKIISSSEVDLNNGSIYSVSKAYKWDTDCAIGVCSGTFQLDSLYTQEGNEGYWELYSYDWLGDPSLPTVINLVRKEVTDPWGIKTETSFNVDYLSISNPAAAYYNSTLINSEAIRRASDNALLRYLIYVYHTGPFTGGFVGQLRSSTELLLGANGTPIEDRVNRFQYYTGASSWPHCGSTQWHIDPKGDSTFYYVPSSTETITRQFLAHDGSVSTVSSGESFVGAGPSWFKMERHTGRNTLTWYRKVDDRGRLVWLVDPNGYRSEVTYDNLNRTKVITIPGGFVPAGVTGDTAWSIWNYYDDVFTNDPVSVKQRLRIGKNLPSREDRAWIDGLSRAYRHDQRNSDGSYDSVVVGFDYAGRSTSETDQLGFVTTTDYDYLDRAVKIRYPDLSHSSDSVKYTVTNTDAVGLTSRFGFPETIIYKHESRDENGHTVNEYYDVRNKLRLRQTYDGQTPLSTYFDYDDLGNLTLIIKPKGDSVRYTYNSLGQLTSERESDFESWTAAILNEFDNNGNLVSRQDPHLFHCDVPECPNVKWQRFVYDKLDRLIESAIEFTGDNGSVRYYDIAGRYFYDQSNSECSKGRLSLEIAYDTLGRCDYAKRYDYDPRGRVKKQVNYFNATLDSTLIAGSGWEFHAHGDSVVIQYTYDWADQLKSITYPDGSVVKYDYDERGRLISVGGVQPSEVDRYARLDYTKRSQLETMVLGSGLQQMDYAYNERGWLLSINDGVSNLNAPADMFGQSLYYDSHGGTPYIGSPQYNGNLFGQKISIRRSDEFFSYRYDESDRLKESFMKPQFSGPMQFDEMSYDANGNITRQSFIDGLSKNYSYLPGTNRLSIVDNEQLRPDDTLTYDAMGNVIEHSGKRASMIYDQANRLVMVAVETGIGADTIRYAYDASGNRIYKSYTYQWQHRCDQQTKAAGGGGELEEEDPRFPPADTASLYCVSSDTKYTYYVLDQGGHVLAEQSTPSPWSATAKFIYAGSQRIAMRDATNKLHYFLNDHLGSTRLVIDSTGTQRDVHRYYSFGKTYAEATNTNQSYRYTGKPLDKEAGLNLYYYGARYYDPELGRFLAIDPAASKYPGLSPYAYCANNPLKNVDPDGGTFLDRVVGIGAALLDNAIGINLRDKYEPTDGADYNAGQDAGDLASAAIGSGEMYVGGALETGGVVVTACSGGITSGVSLPTAGVGAVLQLHGGFNSLSGILNLAMQKGRLGGVDHRTAVKAEADKQRSEGWEITAGGGGPEKAVTTPEGKRRFPDVTAVQDGVTRHTNVGRTTKSGQPVKRERSALDDIERATGSKPGFVPFPRKD